MKEKILITGSEGFIGSHLVEYLLAKNFRIKALVMYNSFNSIGWLDNINSSKKKKKNLELIFGDIRNYDSVRSIVKGCDKIIHLAALIGIPYSYKTQNSYLSTNTMGTLNLLQAAKEFKTKRILITSTSEVYGSGKLFPMNETHQLNAQSPYSASKIAADAFAMSFYKSFSLPVSIIRPFNTFGPRQSARAIIPTIITQILNNQKYLKLGNLSPMRDFVYVNDLSHAFYLSLNSKNIVGETINISSGYSLSIYKLANIIKKKMKSKIIIKEEFKRKRPIKSEVDKLLGCNKKAKRYLKWYPKYSGSKNFIKGLEITIDWFIKNYNQNYRGYIE